MFGFIRLRTIVLVIIIILVLSFFSFDIQSFIEAPQTQANLNYVWSGVMYVWEEYLESPVTYFWNNIFIDLLWNSFAGNLQNIQLGQPTTFEQFAPQVYTGP